MVVIHVNLVLNFILRMDQSGGHDVIFGRSTLRLTRRAPLRGVPDPLFLRRSEDIYFLESDLRAGDERDEFEPSSEEWRPRP